MRPLILVSTINSRHWNTCYLQLLSVQRCQHPPQAERCCWGGGSAMALDVQGGYRAVTSVRPLLDCTLSCLCSSISRWFFQLRCRSILDARNHSHDENDQRTGRLAEKRGFEFVGGT